MLLSLAAVGALRKYCKMQAELSENAIIIHNVRAIYGFQHFVSDVEWLSNLKFYISTFTYRITGFFVRVRNLCEFALFGALIL